jgi:methionyl-tRNA formyltransferase
LVIHWGLGVEDVHNLIRALAPHIGARTFHPSLQGPLKIWRARIFQRGDITLERGHIRTKSGRVLVGCGGGTLEILELQMPGAKRLAAQDFLRGNILDGSFVS